MQCNKNTHSAATIMSIMHIMQIVVYMYVCICRVAKWKSI